MKLFDTYKGLRKEMYVLFFGRIMTNLGSMIFPMLTMILSEKMGMSASKVADYFLILSIVQIPANLIGGKLTDRFNKRNIIIICDAISVLGYIWCGLTKLNTASIIVFGIASVFQTIEWPAYDALAADLSTPKERERAFSLMYFGANLGLIMAPSIGGILFNNYLWLAFLINGAAIASSTILIYFKIKNVDKSYDEEDINEYESEEKEGASAVSLITGNRVVLLYALYTVLWSIAYYQYNYLMPLDVVKSFPETGSVIYGSITSTNCITVVLFTTFMTAKLIRYHEIDKMIIGGALMLTGYAIFALFISSIPAFYISIFIFTIGEIATTISSGPFLSKRIASNYRGRITSITNVCSSLISNVFAKIIGVVYDGYGSISAWGITLIVCALIIVVLFIMRVFDRKQYVELYK